MTYNSQRSGNYRIMDAMPHQGFQASEKLRSKKRHKDLLEQIPKTQFIRLLSILKDLINGRNLEESLKINAALENISSDEDLNKADDETLERIESSMLQSADFLLEVYILFTHRILRDAEKKLVMEETFERNRVRPTDPDFEYDIAVDFPKQVETSGWDSDFSDF